MGSRRALLVGICYKDAEEIPSLRGCWNDVEQMRERLITRFRFPKDSICMLQDKPGTSPQCLPTGAVIRERLETLLRDVKCGDTIVFFYSGHGYQMPPEGEPDETGMKEAIVPVDLNFITDDDFRVLVDKIPNGVAFTFIADCCHSGGLIAHAEQQVGSVHTKPTELLTALGPQVPEEEEEGLSEENVMEILAAMLGSTFISSQQPSLSLLDILAMIDPDASSTAQQQEELSLADLLAFYAASNSAPQQQTISMSDILESLLASAASPPEGVQKILSTSSFRDLQQDKQRKKDRLQRMLGSTKAHNIQRLLRSTSNAHRSVSRGLGAGADVLNFGGHYPPQGGHYPPQDHNSFSQHNSESLQLPHQ